MKSINTNIAIQTPFRYIKFFSRNASQFLILGYDEKESFVLFSLTAQDMRPKIKLVLFPLSRPTVKKSPDRKNFISIFHLELFFFARNRKH